jgi:hypothetical protein
VKTTQYVRQERAIAAADSEGIRDRWLWGLRILRDPEAMTESGKSLRHGVTQELIHAAARAGLTLTDREIQRRIQCARTYKTEAEIRQAMSDFKTWFDLAQAYFPKYETPDGEPPADHRTEAERQQDRARQLLDLVGPQAALFPLDTFEPVEVTLKDLQEYADEQDALTARFVAHGEKRREYLGQLIDAAGGDMSLTWEAASRLLPPEIDDPLAQASA